MTRLQQLTKDLLELERKLVTTERERKKILADKARIEAAIEKEKKKPK